jgi:hypothetical protein
MGEILIESDNKATFTEGNSTITIEVNHTEGNVFIRSGEKLLALDLKTLTKLPDKIKIALIPWYPSNNIPLSRGGEIAGLLNLLDEMGGYNKSLVSKEEFIKKAKERGVPIKTTTELIEEMKGKGDIYEPIRGSIQASHNFSKTRTQ